MVGSVAPRMAHAPANGRTMLRRHFYDARIGRVRVLHRVLVQIKRPDY